MALTVQDEQRTLDGLKKKTEEIIRAAQAGSLKEIIHKSKELVINNVIEEEKKGKDESTLRLIEQIRKAKAVDAKQLAEVKQELITEEEVVTTHY